MNIVEDIVIVGRHAVKEAIVSGHTINKIWIQEGIRKQQINDILKKFRRFRYKYIKYIFSVLLH